MQRRWRSTSAARSSIREIGGSQITVVCERLGRTWARAPGLPLHLDQPPAGLETDSIEGDDVYLEATHAAMVRGRRVKIGPGCRVKSVEFSESLQVDSAAVVKDRAYTGEGPAPAVETVTVSRPEGCPEDAGGRRGGWCNSPGWWSRHPVLRAPLAILGILIAAGVVYVAVTVVLQVVALVVALVLVCVVLCLILGAVGIPVMVVGAVLRDLILLPFRALGRLFGWSWPQPPPLVVRGAGKRKARWLAATGPGVPGSIVPGNLVTPGGIEPPLSDRKSDVLAAGRWGRRVVAS